MWRRITMIRRGLIARRARPDLAALAAETDPDRFVWSILPHAARSFAASIVVLPPAESRAAAIAYLYARMLDTYEDLHPDETSRPSSLRTFAERLTALPPAHAEPIDARLARDDRDRLHVLLLDRADMVDAVFVTLSESHRTSIVELISRMAEGMAVSSERFEAQGGVLTGDDQLLEYCHHVIGNPARFTIELLGGDTGAVETETSTTSELIQLANITRDIEKDLARGVAYDASLRPHLHAYDEEAIRQARRRMTGMALLRAGAYRDLYRNVGLPPRPGTRLAAVLMLAFTDLHYRTMATRVGTAPWKGTRGKLATVLVSLPAALSNRYTDRIIDRVTERLIGAAPDFAPSSSVAR